MAESLASTLADLNLNAQQLSGAAFDTRLAEEDNGTQENYRPRKRTRQTAEDLKASLETEFLAPSSRFSPDWLNHLQRSACHYAGLDCFKGETGSLLTDTCVCA